METKIERRINLQNGYTIVNPDNPIDLEWYLQHLNKPETRKPYKTGESPAYDEFCLRYRIWTPDSYWHPSSPYFGERYLWENWCEISKRKLTIRMLDGVKGMKINADNKE